MSVLWVPGARPWVCGLTVRCACFVGMWVSRACAVHEGVLGVCVLL